PGANPESATKKAASGLFGKNGASSRPAAPGAKKVMSEAEMQQMVGDDAAEAFGGIEPFDGAANQAAPDPVAIDLSRLRLGLLAKKHEGNPNPDPGANPEPAENKAASGLFGKTGASSRPAALGAEQVMSES